MATWSSRKGSSLLSWRGDGQSPALAHPVIVRHAIERDAEYQLAGPRRPGQEQIPPPAFPSPEQTMRHNMSERPGPASDTAFSNRRFASSCALPRSTALADSAAIARNRSRIPGHGHRGRKLPPFPIRPELLAGIILTPGDMTARIEPAKRAFR
jgi:hypothetical protein